MLDQEYKKKLESILRQYRDSLSNVREARANSGLFESILVDSHGSRVVLKSIASVSVIDSKSVSISPWNINFLGQIKDSLLKSNIDMSVVVKSSAIIVNLPEMNGEIRENLVRYASELSENARISVRKVRQDTLNKLKKENMSDDDIIKYRSIVQKDIDVYVKEIDTLLKAKIRLLKL